MYAISKQVGPSEVLVGERPTEPVESPIRAVEAPVTPEPTPAPKQEQDPRLVELERKERAIRAQAKQLAQEKALIEQLKTASQPKPGAMTAEEWKAMFLQDPTKLGIDMDVVANKFLTAPSEEAKELAAIKAEMQALRDADKARQEQLEQASKQAYENAKKQIRSEAQRLIETRPQDFETISAMGAHEDVLSLIERTYQEENRLMSVEEAAKEVEDYLLDKAVKYAGLNKVKTKTTPASPAGDATTAPVEPKTQPTQQTLTRALSQSSRPLTAAERRQRAIAAFTGSLNK